MVNKKFSTIYLQGKGLTLLGGKLAQKDTLSSDEVRKQAANQIYDRLINAFAMIEVAKEVGVFTEEYAEDLIKQAKDKDNEFGAKDDIKKAIHQEIYKAMKKDGQKYPFYQEVQKGRPHFN